MGLMSLTGTTCSLRNFLFSGIPVPWLNSLPRHSSSPFLNSFLHIVGIIPRNWGLFIYSFIIFFFKQKFEKHESWGKTLEEKVVTNLLRYYLRIIEANNWSNRYKFIQDYGWVQTFWELSVTANYWLCIHNASLYVWVQTFSKPGNSVNMADFPS